MAPFDRHLVVPEPDPDYHQQAGRGGYRGKPSPGRMASPTEVHNTDGTRETLRLVKRTLRDGTEVYSDASGSGRLFGRRQSGLGVTELSEDEIAALGFLEEEDVEDE